MSRARASALVPLPPGRAFDLWLDTSRWPTWVEGFAHVVDRDPNWPMEGTKIVWESKPNGRGRVTERVIERAEGGRLSVQLFEDKLNGRQTVTFDPVDDGTQVVVELDYALNERGPLKAITNAIFIRGALQASLERTLRKFATEAAEETGLTSDT